MRGARTEKRRREQEKKEPIGSGDGKHLYLLTDVTSTFFRRTSSPKNNLGNLLREFLLRSETIIQRVETSFRSHEQTDLVEW